MRPMPLMRFLSPSRPWTSFLLDAFLIFLLTAALIKPLWKVKYLDKWYSIESTFVSDARFLTENWPHPKWQPLWYGGTRFDYVYPPALRYGTALLCKAYPRLLPVRAYHIFIAFFYCLGISGVYVLVRTAGGSRGMAWLAAAAAALLSPSFLFFKWFRQESWVLVPHRLGVLVRYGEGPHMSALAVVPLALAACWRAVEKARPLAMAAAAVMCALVVSTNFYGATSLAVLFPILVWSLWLTRQDNRMWMRAGAIAILSYGLTAFWLTPSYFRITAANLKIVSRPGNMWSTWIALAFAVGFVLVSNKRARGKTHLAYPVFVWGAFLTFALNVLGEHFVNFRVVGEPERMVPEFDLAAILMACLGIHKLWRADGLRARTCIPRTAAVVIAVAAFSTSALYLRHAWHIYPRDPDYTKRIEYVITDWMAKHHPDFRTMATGSVRFWYDAWHDLAQLGGGSEQGMLNPIGNRGQWQIFLGSDPRPSIVWLQALGVDAVIVHDKTSQEEYRDFAHPYKFQGVLPVLYDDGRGNAIYKVPRKYPGLARVVEKARAEALKPIRQETEDQDLEAYVGVIEKGPDSAAPSSWEATDAMRIRATLKDGQALAVMASYDPYWRAYSAGRSLSIRKDPMGHMLIDAPPGEHDLRLVFEQPLENTIGRIVTLLAVLAVAGLALKGFRSAEVRT